jgi:Tfp pilus assembly protein PilO
MTTALKRIGAFAGIMAVVVIAAWFLLLFRPETKSVSNAHKAKAAAEQKASQLQSEVVSLQGLEKMIPADKQQYGILSAAVPDNPQLALAIDEIRTVATTSGLQIANLNPTPPTTSTGAGSSATKTSGGAGPPSIAVSITANGTYQQSMSFVSGLSALPRTFVVDHITLTGGSNTHGLAVTINARIFYAGQATP